jgi:hypothetical protein
MTTTTIIRNFANPGYTPAAHVPIRNDRFYLLTMQNVETDPRCDYVGLGEGEYTVLVPGANARAERESRLNHCNRIQEWRGKVWSVTLAPWGNPRPAEYFRSGAEARARVEAFHAEERKWLDACITEAERHERATPTVGFNKEFHLRCASECRAVTQTYTPWTYESLEVA